MQVIEKQYADKNAYREDPFTFDFVEETSLVINADFANNKGWYRYGKHQVMFWYAYSMIITVPLCTNFIDFL